MGIDEDLYGEKDKVVFARLVIIVLVYDQAPTIIVIVVVYILGACWIQRT